MGKALWESLSERDEVLKYLIGAKADLEDKVFSDTMLIAYDCLQIIVNSGKIQLESDFVEGLERNSKEHIFRNVNDKYSMLSFSNTFQQRTTMTNEINLDSECEKFISIMNEHPIATDEFNSSSANSSHDVLARLLALRRLEKVLFSQEDLLKSSNKCYGDIYPFLLNICHSRDPEESRIVSSRCLGELINAQPRKPLHEQESTGEVEVTSSLNDPMSSIKRMVLSMLGQYLLAECADTSFIAMKTVKALLSTPAGNECWETLETDVKSLLSSFNTVDNGKLQREAVRLSDSCLERLKAMSGSLDSDSWCWSDKLWTCLDSKTSSCDLWIRNITCSIISCCFGKGSKVGKGDQDFFWICQGLCAKESNFAACIFPALIFHLLDSEAIEKDQEDNGVQNNVMSRIAIGSPTSRMNKAISHSFSLILRPSDGVAPQAIKLLLNTLELLRAITEHRFLTSPEHTKNKSTTQKQNSSSSKKRRSRNTSGDVDSFASSPKWRGLPYGVVLRLSGLDIAKACFKVKRYYSALYYAEMSMVCTLF